MKNVRKISYTLLSLVLCLSMLCISASAADFKSAANNAETTDSAQQGSDVTLNLTIFDSGFVLVPVEENMIEDNSAYHYGPLSDPDREANASFIHNLYDRNGVFMGTVTTYVTGIYSQADNTAQITSILAVFGGDYASNFGYNVTRNGNISTLHIYYNGTKTGSISYKIATNGVISQV